MFRSMILAMSLCMALSKALAHDGFILTHWGTWTVEEGIKAVDDAYRVGARHVSQLVKLCQTAPDSSEMHWCYARPGESLRESYQGRRLLGVYRHMREKGMELGLIPFLLVGDGSSRSYIKPKDREAWFRDYSEKVVELAEWAQELGATEVLAASELGSMYPHSKQWRSIIASIREVYKGHLTITTVIPQYLLIDFWDVLDSIGVSAYFPLTVKEDWHSLPVLEAAWQTHKKHLLEFAKLWKKPLTFAEVGYPATNVAAYMPWDYQWSKRTLDLAQQERCFQAFRKAFSTEKALRRFQMWGLSAQPDPSRKTFGPIGKPAEGAVAQIFKERAALKKRPH